MCKYRNLLQVGTESSLIEIKRSYRKLARRHHPDKGGDPVVFRKLNEAYRYLARTGVDTTGYMFEEPPEPFYTSTPPTQLYPVTISLADVCRGTTITIPIRRSVVEQGSLCRCAHCNGTGVDRIIQTLPGSQMWPSVDPHITCRRCCDGFVSDSITRTIETVIVDCPLPMGCPAGMMLYLPGKGDHLPGVPPADLVLVVGYGTDGPFTVVSGTLDLEYTLSLTPSESRMGFTRTIRHPDGTDQRISADIATEPGTYMISDSGIHFIAGNRCGHLYVNVQVMPPGTPERSNQTEAGTTLELDQTVQTGDHRPGDKALVSIGERMVPTQVEDILYINQQQVQWKTGFCSSNTPQSKTTHNGPKDRLPMGHMVC